MSDSTWPKIGAVGGVAYLILQGISHGLFQAGGAQPTFKATTAEILDFFQLRDARFF